MCMQEVTSQLLEWCFGVVFYYFYFSCSSQFWLPGATDTNAWLCGSLPAFQWSSEIPSWYRWIWECSFLCRRLQQVWWTMAVLWWCPTINIVIGEKSNRWTDQKHTFPCSVRKKHFITRSKQREWFTLASLSVKKYRVYWINHTVTCTILTLIQLDITVTLSCAACWTESEQFLVKSDRNSV